MQKKSWFSIFKIDWLYKKLFWWRLPPQEEEVVVVENIEMMEGGFLTRDNLNNKCDPPQNLELVYYQPDNSKEV